MNYTVKTPAGLFVMTAPIGVIQEVFCLHIRAVERVERLLRQNPGCKVPVHFNGQRPFGSLESITVEPDRAAEMAAPDCGTKVNLMGALQRSLEGGRERHD